MSLILAVLLWAALAQVECLHFNFPNFQDENRSQLHMGNTSRIFLGAIQVTPDVMGAPIHNFSGRTVYKKPFRLWSNQGQKTASFNTTFVLNIKNQTSPAGGEGLAFILAANPNYPQDSSGQWLGIVNPSSNGSIQANIVAVEFDTRKSYPDDLDDNHVGLDVNTINSRAQVSLNPIGVYLSIAVDVTVTIRYDGKNLSVFVGQEDLKNSLLFSEPINLSSYLPETVYVGFSGSTGNLTQLNCVRSWEFSGSDIDEEQQLWWVWVVCVVGAALAVLAGCAFYLYRKRKTELEDPEDAYPDIEEAIRGCSRAPRKFGWKELSKATGKFNPKNKLGKGGFGTVYKGMLGNMEVAVKKISKKSTQGKQEFMAEVTTIGYLHHRNLVKLIGWCYEKRELLLVYEYLPNGSLDRFIFYDDKWSPAIQETTTPLSWEKRLAIICGVAQALDYLHNGCEKTVLHRDIKASNIMLDSEFNAKLGDFGLARTILQKEQTHHSTKEIAGTPGYMAPESILTARFTVETDVYAFGVVILEVACARKPGGQTERDNYLSNIVHGLWELYRKGRILEGADPRLKGEFTREEMECVLLLGLACCHPNPNKRPSMKTVLQVLSGEAPPPEVPTERPAFMWPPMPPSFKDWDQSLTGSQLSPFSDFTGR
ncbi:hypothetical protein Tsubulata_040775 [Turnera subulata]|uniref:non-specific serine/threonine protein kinase n=1 Tax=Turnera subulata TaxID=218843 RepID=A0A9Q0FGK2_9ROSI|nr:hypothetical protein Tsubulata_040775 [Turnera subulata]